MSIDNFIRVPTGVRNDKSIGYRKYKSWSDMLTSEKSDVPKHQVFLAHGANVLIDEQYYFEDPEDARWFWNEGYHGRLFLLDEEEGLSAGYDRMSLWIDGALAAKRDTPGGDGFIDGFEPEPLDMTKFPVDMLDLEEEMKCVVRAIEPRLTGATASSNVRMLKKLQEQI